MPASIPDEFSSPVGQLADYTALKGGFAAWLKKNGTTQVNEAAPSPETQYLTPELANKHVDIRSMITTDPDHGRPQRQMDLLHQMENAFHQSLALVSGTASGGHFNLTWEVPAHTATYLLTTDYVLVHAPTTMTIARSGGSTIPSGASVLVSYSTSVGSYENEAHTLTGTTPVALTHQADNVVAASVTVTNNSYILTSEDLAYNITPEDLQEAIEDFVPQVYNSLAYSASIFEVRPAVTVTSGSGAAPYWPYIITLADELNTPPVREIGSWAVEFGVDYSALTGSTPVLGVFNLRTDENFLQTADPSPDLTQLQVETVAGSTQEAWGTDVGGMTGVTSVTVGKDADFYKWRSIEVLFDGAAVNADLISSTPLTPVNIEQLNSNHANTFIDLVMPEIGTLLGTPDLDAALCTIQFTSSTDGLFGGATDSLAVPFTGNIVGGTHFHKALTAFTGSTDWTRVTGVKIHLESSGGNNPTAASELTIMSLRALDTAWLPKALDVNTRTQHLESPVSLTAVDTGLGLTSPIIRSSAEYGATTNDAANNVTSDPTLADGAVSVKFNSGSQVHHAAITEPTNHIIIYLRQRNNAGTTWDWIQAQLSWGWDGTSVIAYIATAKGSSDGSAITLTQKHLDTGTALANNTDYLFTADIEGTVLSVKVQTVDSEGGTSDVYTPTPVDNVAYERVRGRVGYYAQIGKDKDVEIDYLRSSNVSFATLVSAIFRTHTPVDGAQLFVSGSDAVQLWTDWSLINVGTGDPTDDQLVVDTAKKLSPVSSTKFIGGGLSDYSGIESNIVDFDDWTQMYLDFDVWFPGSLSAHNNVQELSMSGSASAGTFKVAHDGAETAAIPWNATAAQVQHALELLGTIGVGNVLCTGGPLPSVKVTIKFIGALAGADISTLIVTDDSVTGATPEVTQAGIRPQLFLKQPGTEGDYTVGTIGPFNIPFVPGTWSHVRFSLKQLANHAVNPYKVQILTQQPSTQVWWVDNFKIAHRSVGWEMRAIENGDWFPFLDVVNNPRGALHLPRSARGKAIQVRARALRADSWISNYTLKPHYAELGRLQGNDNRVYIDYGFPKGIGTPITTVEGKNI